MTKTIVECRFCGQSHGVLCPSVKSIEYFEDGQTVKKVEFKGAGDFYAPLPHPWTWEPTNWGPTWHGSEVSRTS